MHILALETSGPHCSVAIIDEQGNLKEAASKGTLNHLQFLMPLMTQVLSDCQLQLSDIAAIAVSEGPGSFTGIRIGVSSARALAQVIGCPLIAVPTLKAFAYHVPNTAAMICPIFDARRNQIYGGAYQWTEQAVAQAVAQDAGQVSEQAPERQIVEWVPAGPYMLDAYLERLAKVASSAQTRELIFFGDGLKPYGEQVKIWSARQPFTVHFAEEGHRYQEAGSVARLARLEAQQGNLKDYQKVVPNYMRKAEAQRKLEEKLAVEHG